MTWKVCGASDLPIYEKDIDWDGQKARDAIFEWAATDDGFDVAKVKKLFFVYDDEKPENKTSYKLPFGMPFDGKPYAVKSGLRAVASRLPKTDIPDDVKEKVRAKLDKYFEKLHKEESMSVKGESMQLSVHNDNPNAILLSADDVEQPMVWDVVVISAGNTVWHGDLYIPASTLQRAVDKFNGVVALTDHDIPSVHNVMGWFDEAKWDDERGGITAKFHMLRSTDLAKRVREAWEAGKKDLFNFSADVFGVVDWDDTLNKPVLNEITKVTSVDLVVFPAANGHIEDLIQASIESMEDVKVNEKPKGENVVKAIEEKFDAMVEKLREEQEIKLAKIELEQRLAQTTFDDKAKELVRTILGDKFTSDDIEKAIAKVADALPAPAEPIKMGEDSADKAQNLIVATLLGEDYEGQKPEESIHRLFAKVTGIRLSDVPKSDLARAIITASYGLPTRLRFASSADWGTLFTNALNIAVAKDYALPQFDDWKKVVSDIVPLSDMTTQTVTTLGYVSPLPTVAAGNPYTTLSGVTHNSETYTPTKKGEIWAFTFEDIVNDRIKAFRKMPKRVALAAKVTIYKAVFDIFVNNPTLADGKALFSTDHANTGTDALSFASYGAAATAMAQQAALGASDIVLSNRPRYLVVPSALWNTAETIRRADYTDSSMTPNIYKETFETIEVGYWSDANDWVAVADPNMVPTLEVGFLDGKQKPEIVPEAMNSGNGFTADEFRWKVRLVFGVGVADYRGMYKSIVA